VTGPARVDEDGRVHGTGPPRQNGALELPGFVNAHSHAFQRALRGRVEVRSAERPNDDFWAWRTAMYRDSARVTVDDVTAIAAWAYADMLKSGFTTVGEFHYLHHDVGARALPGPQMSVALARAAALVGIRLVLLETAYARGGATRALTDEQRRFSFPAVGDFLRHVEASLSAGAGAGVAIHSVRACPRAWIEELAHFSRERGLVLHVHACEQRREIEECRAEHGMDPIALLEAAGALGPKTTLVHATHVGTTEIARIAAAGATVCLTPSTERNLGDGLCPIADLVAAGVPVCVGTDSHARIDVVDELRSLEDHERLRLEKRNVLVPPGGRLAHALIPAGTRAGARALGVDTRGDRVLVRMPLEGRGDPAAGLDAWLVGGSGRDVEDVDVGGRAVVRGGRLVLVSDDDVEARALETLRKLRG
jgi:formimidoylglutamate deiminase